MKRAAFIKSASWGILGLPLIGSQLKKIEGQLDPKLVEEFVRIAHGKVEETIAMHKEYPILLNVAWDWGGGDFETALGAASHVGTQEIILYLLEQGAQMNLLTACVLGEIDIVKSMLAYNPALLHMKGPHGFSALHHANVGGEHALEVKEYLIALGAKETRSPLPVVK